MNTTWYLDFRLSRGGPGASAPLVAALKSVVPSVTVKPSAWSGNPRDFYSRTVEVTGAAGPGASLSGRLGTEGSMDGAEVDPAVADFSRVQVELTGRDVEPLWELWERLRSALGTVGYQDETTLGAPGVIIRHLRQAGLGERAEALASRVTEALLAREAQRRPEDTSVTLANTRAGDLPRVLREVRAPSHLTHLDLSENDLAAVPDELLRFPRLEWLNLSGNQLQALGPLPARLPGLRRLLLERNPLGAFVPAELAACRTLVQVSLAGTPHARLSR